MNSQMRLVSLYAKLMNGEVVKKDEEAVRFGVDKRTIQRDIENLRDYFLAVKMWENMEKQSCISVN